MATLYEPINVYKAVAQNIGIVDGPFEYFTVAGIRMPMPFTTRMTVVSLARGRSPPRNVSLSRDEAT